MTTCNITVLDYKDSVSVADDAVVIDLKKVCTKIDPFKTTIKRHGQEVVVRCCGERAIRLREKKVTSGDLYIMVDTMAHIDDHNCKVVIPLTHYEV